MSNMFWKKFLRKLLAFAAGGYKLSFWDQFLDSWSKYQPTELFITIFFAFLSYFSYIKIAILLGSIVRVEFKLSSPPHTPQPPELHQQHIDKLVSRNDAPPAKN